MLEGLLGLVVLAVWWFFMGDTIMGWVRAPFRWISGAKDQATTKVTGPPTETLPVDTEA
jgi:hypothetical protein